MNDIELIEMPTNIKFQCLLNKTYNRLIVKSYLGRKSNKDGYVHYWTCLCNCGNSTIASSRSLIRKSKQSCGCLQKEWSARHCVTHSMSNSDEYNTWKHIKSRCLSKTNDSYSEYGGRGIKICDRWLESFESFYKDMGPRPSDKHSIDRIDVNGNYTPENCRWATKREQNNNTRRNIYISFNNERLTITEWSKRVNLDYRILSYRFKKGWTAEQILTTPKFTREKK